MTFFPTWSVSTEVWLEWAFYIKTNVAFKHQFVFAPKYCKVIQQYHPPALRWNVPSSWGILPTLNHEGVGACDGKTNYCRVEHPKDYFLGPWPLQTEVLGVGCENYHSLWVQRWTAKIHRQFPIKTYSVSYWQPVAVWFHSQGCGGRGNKQIQTSLTPQLNALRLYPWPYISKLLEIALGEGADQDFTPKASVMEYIEIVRTPKMNHLYMFITNAFKINLYGIWLLSSHV